MVLNRVAVLPVEIVPESGMYDYHARYTAGATEFFCPARVTEDVAAAITDCALTAHATLGLSGLSRTDVVIDAEGTVWFLKVNVAPGMTETSLMPQAMAEADLAVGEVFASLIDATLELKLKALEVQQRKDYEQKGAVT